MRLSTQVKPISYVKANAARIVDELDNGGAAVVITKNGEAKAVVQSIADYERTRETLALLKIIALGKEDIKAGRVVPAREAIEQIRAGLRSV